VAELFATALLLDIGSWTLILLGGFFSIVGGIGLIRLPDFYSRLHAAGIADTLGAALIISGMVLQTHGDGVTIRLLLIGSFIFLTSPTSTHALARAALATGMPHWRRSVDDGIDIESANRDDLTASSIGDSPNTSADV
jgi:multicomponent Na+:H+ antiporter subunit G